MTWTLDELVERVAAALAGSAYPGAPNGRVRDLPDRRVIRWYSTIGLVDRPSAMRGRTALYGPRHLMQLVAVKRLQAEGRSLAEIQAELTGAPDALLRSIAAVPPRLLAMDEAASDRRTGGDAAPARPAAEPTGPPELAEPAELPELAEPAEPAAVCTEEPAASRSRFWAAAVTPFGSAPPAPSAPRPAKRPDTATRLVTGAVTALAAVPLADRVMLLLPAVPDAADVPDIQAAARPLLDLLAGRGLIGSTDEPDRHPRGGPSGPHADPRSAP